MGDSFYITGVAGFIGSHVAERLLRRGDRIHGLDNFDPFYDRSMKEGNLASLSVFPEFRFTEGDIRDPAVLAAWGNKGPVDAVIHLAAKAGVRPSLRDPVGYSDVNVLGTVRLLEWARDRNAPRILFASSSSVYGGNQKIPFAEEDPVDHPVSPYAATKKAGELLCHTFCHLYGMHIVSLRFFTVYGPRQRPEMAAPGGTTPTSTTSWTGFLARFPRRRGTGSTTLESRPPSPWTTWSPCWSGAPGSGR